MFVPSHRQVYGKTLPVGAAAAAFIGIALAHTLSTPKHSLTYFLNSLVLLPPLQTLLKKNSIDRLKYLQTIDFKCL